MMTVEIKINGNIIGVAHITNIGGQYVPPDPEINAETKAIYSVRYARIDSNFRKEFEIKHDRDAGAEALASLVLARIVG